MNDVVIPGIVLIVASTAITFISAFLSKDNYPVWINTSISLAVIVITALFCTIIGTNHDFITFFAFCVALVYGPYKPLYKYLVFGPQTSVLVSDVKPAPLVKEPKPIILPGNPGNANKDQSI